MQKARTDFQKSFEQKIRNLKSTNPKQYWKILNSNKQNKNNTLPDITSLYDHFKTLNKNSDNPEISINNNTRSEPDLDKEFSDEEIFQAIKTLKKTKPQGMTAFLMNIYVVPLIFFSLFLKIYLIIS